MKPISFIQISIVLLGAAHGNALAQSWSIDPTFDPGTGPAQIAPFAGNIHASALQMDGKIIIGGTFLTYDGVERNNIARIGPDGTLDTSFDPGAGTDGTINTLVLQPDGKVVIGGLFTEVDGVECGRIARLNNDGSLDQGFNCGSGAGGEVDALLLQDDGKILVAGFFTSFNGVNNSRLTRLNADGTNDGSFDVGEYLNSTVKSLALQADGKILVGGSFTAYHTTSRVRIARLNADGTLDETFDPGAGATSSDFPAVMAIAVEPDGQIIIGGSFTQFDGVQRRRLARLNSDGSLDASFSPTFDSDVLTLLIEPDGHILVGGVFTTVNNDGPSCMVRLNASGVPVSNFDLGLGFQGTGRGIATFFFQPDGKLFAGGRFDTFDGTVRVSIVRLMDSILLGIADRPSPLFQLDQHAATSSITVHPTDAHPLTLTLVDISGRTVLSTTVGIGPTLLDVASFSRGAYCLTAYSKEGRHWAERLLLY